MWPCSKKCAIVGVGFEVSFVQATSTDSVHFLLPAGQDAELVAPFPASCLPACHHDDDNGLNLWNCMPPQLNVFLYKSCNHGVITEIEALTKIAWKDVGIRLIVHSKRTRCS